MNYSPPHFPQVFSTRLVLLLILLFPAEPSPVFAQDWSRDLDIADSIMSAGIRDSAAMLVRSVIASAGSSLGERDTAFANILLVAASVYEKGEGYGTEAERLVRKALNIFEFRLGESNLRLVRVLRRLSFLVLTNNGKQNEAVELMKRGIAICKSALGLKHPETAHMIRSLGGVHFTVGNLHRSLELTQEALDIWLETSPDDYDRISHAITLIGHIFSEQGKFAQALPYYEKAAAMRKEAFGATNPMIAAYGLGNLAAAYGNVGRFSDEERYSQESNAFAAAATATLGEKIDGWQGDANWHYRRGRYAVAESLYQIALDALMHSMPNQRYYVAETLLEFAETKIKLHKFLEAESLLWRAKSLFGGVSDSLHPVTVGILASLAECAWGLQQFTEAEHLFRRAIKASILSLGEHHPVTASLLESFARYSLERGSKALAATLASQAFDAWRTHTQTGSLFLSERDALFFSTGKRRAADLYLQIALGHNGTNDSHRIAEIILDTKGQSLATADKRLAEIRSSSDPSIDSLLDKWCVVRQQLSNAYFNTGSRSRDHFYRATIDSLNSLANNLETALARIRGHTLRNDQATHLRIDILAASLPDATALLDLYRYNVSHGTDTQSRSNYALLVIDKNGLRKVLSLDSSVDSLVAAFVSLSAKAGERGSLPAADDRSLSRLLRTLYNSVFGKLERTIDSTNTLFVSPDGPLNLVSFATLIDPKENYLIEKYRIHMLSSAHDILREYGSQSGTGLLAFGNPDFDADPIDGASSPALASVARSQIGGITRNIRASCDALRDIRLTQLPGAQAEVEQIQKVIPGSTVFRGRGATEENVKKLSSGHRILHFATHAFFEGAGCTKRIGTHEQYLEHPLLQSGLFLAGANHRSRADSLGSEDGILTALEVSAMDLRGTDLVVLSACETGLGKVEQGEGVYGLRRAFQMAGAKTVVSSLWKVPDKETMQFMKTLYSTKAETYSELMQQVALKRIREARLRGRPTHPFTWGAFVATGDWRVR